MPLIFVPLPSLKDSASVLHPGILKSQIADCFQVLEHLADRRHGFSQHPCIKMWRPYGRHLLGFAQELCSRLSEDETQEAGPDLISVMDDITATPDKTYTGPAFDQDRRIPPHWLGLDELHRSHRSRLLTNYPEEYRHLGWTEPHHVSIVWPLPPAKPKPIRPNPADPNPSKPTPDSSPENAAPGSEAK